MEAGDWGQKRYQEEAVWKGEASLSSLSGVRGTEGQVNLATRGRHRCTGAVEFPSGMEGQETGLGHGLMEEAAGDQQLQGWCRARSCPGGAACMLLASETSHEAVAWNQTCHSLPS